MSKTLQKLSRDEALQKLDSFIAELDSSWEREGTPWGPELLALLQDFRQAASGDSPDLRRLQESRDKLVEFLSRPKMKGFSPLQTYADSILESYGQPKA